MPTKCENIKDIVSLKVLDLIHYKESLMLLKTYVAAFSLLILQRLHVKREEISSYFTMHRVFV